MNYYERHLGDYARDTAHLTMLEHGAYGLLLDRYYSTEAGIPADQVHRLARVRTPAERAAVDAVLAEFFELVNGVWVNGRASREIEKAQSKINAARSNGTRGGRPKRNPTGTDAKPSGLLVGSENETQAKAHQTPDTRHQIPDTRQNTHTPLNIEAESREATAAGRVCLGLREAGISDTNPGHPGLLALLEAGASDAEIVGAAAACVSRGKGFAYLLGMVKKQRAEAAHGMVRGAMPPAETTYARMMRERMEQVAPAVAAKRPNGPAAAMNVIDMEVANVSARRLG